MANTSDIAIVNGNNALGVRALSAATISTLFNNNILLAILAARNGTKEGIKNVGEPSIANVFSGAKLAPAKIKEIGECSQYSPQIEGVLQIDGKKAAYRDTMPVISAGSGATFSVTVTAGVITAVSVSGGGSGYAGAVPTIIVTDSTGKGAILTATISGGAITAINILSGGSGYTSPTLIAQTGASEGEKYTRPVFKWCEYKNVGYVYNRDIRRAREVARNDQKYFDAQINSLVQDAQQRVIAGQVKQCADDLWFGSPSSQTADLWDSPFGIQAAVHASNTYAGLDRSVAANYYWRAKRDTAAQTMSLTQLWQDMMFKKGCADNGGNVDLILCGADLFPKYQSESQAYQINANNDPGLRMIAQFGFQVPVIKYNNTYVAYDWRCPPGTVMGLNTSSWIIAFREGAKWTSSEMYDQRAVEGGKDASLFYVETQWMPMCVAPAFGNIQYTALS